MANAIVNIPNRLEVFTYEDYLNLPDDGKRYEIINGELYKVPAPTLRHQDTIGEFHLAIGNFLKTNPSTEKRDRTIKLKAYSKFGVHEYWMADEEKATVEVWRRRGKKLALHAVLDKKQTLTTPLLPGLRILLEIIFRKSCVPYPRRKSSPLCAAAWSFPRIRSH